LDWEVISTFFHLFPPFSTFRKGGAKTTFQKGCPKNNFSKRLSQKQPLRKVVPKTTFEKGCAKTNNLFLSSKVEDLAPPFSKVEKGRKR
jgi:hypothetical protein